MHACLSSDLDIIKSVQVIAANLLKFQLQTVLLLSFEYISMADRHVRTSSLS